jgi:hypothetical protein
MAKDLERECLSQYARVQHLVESSESAATPKVRSGHLPADGTNRRNGDAALVAAFILKGVPSLRLSSHGGLDASAFTFAEIFYDEFTGGKYLGESIRAVKSVLKSSDPTYLTYTLYGNSLAKLS